MIFKRKSVISLVLSCVTALMCVFPANAVDETEKVIRVMPLGDSITDGYSTLGGYRQPLANMLEENGYSDNIDFVGPNWGGNCYDCQHAGYSGYSIDDIKQEDSISGARTGLQSFIDWLMESYPADVVMLQIGTNDILSYYDLDNIGTRLEKLVDTILTYIPDDGMLYLSTIPCMDATNTLYINEYYFTVESMDACVDAYNAEIMRIADEKQAEGQNVILSDVNSVLTKADLYDGVHPSESGYQLMAEHWYNILTGYIDGTTELPTDPTEPPICIEPYSAISIDSMPNKTEYEIGEELDLSGLKITYDYYYGIDGHDIVYDNVSPFDYPEHFTVDTSSFNSEQAGTYTITVSGTEELIWYAYPVSFEVTVKESIATETTQSTTTVGSNLKGDVNCDNSVSVSDLVYLNKCLTGQEEMVLVQFVNADMNDNDKLDVFDAVLLRRMLMLEF